MRKCKYRCWNLKKNDKTEELVDIDINQEDKYLLNHVEVTKPLQSKQHHLSPVR